MLNSLIVDSLLESSFYEHATEHYSLTLAGVWDCPIELKNTVKIERRDLCSSHEEADIIITKHAISSSVLGRSVQVVCDDTDVFILLVHFYHTHGPGSPMIMSSPVKERAVIDIKQTSEVHKDIAPDLLALHGLSGADTVSSIHGIGKSTVVKIAKKRKT